MLVFPGVTLLDVAGPAEVLSEANRYGARYEVVIYSVDGQPVRSASDIQIAADAAVADAAGLDTVLLPGSDALAGAGLDPALVEAASRLAGLAPRTASVCTGAFLLAATGRLEGRRATTHWRFADVLARRHSRVNVEPDALFVIDGPIATSAGITAGIDLLLALVEADHGPDLARDVARSLVVFMQRPGGQSQFSAPSRTPRPRRQPLRDLLDEIAADPAGDYSVPALAEAAGTSTRHLTRLFQQELGTTPAKHIERIRLEAAQTLLDAGHTVTSAAARSGFGSDESLRRAFAHHLGVAPTTYRQRFASTTGTRGADRPPID
ncbi:MAG TPA: helix-turn-helix domain-containing protein [Actinocrinis sp.]|nr:helix-turn-helix domain-containing protein [Actinocrinis sp.]